MYSDEPQLIGSVFPLTPELTASLASGVATAAHISELDAAENRLESDQGRLIEVYVPIKALDGTPLLVESYLRLDSVLTSGRPSPSRSCRLCSPVWRCSRSSSGPSPGDWRATFGSVTRPASACSSERRTAPTRSDA